MVLLYACSTVRTRFDLSKLNWPVAWFCYQIIARSTNNKANPPLNQHAKWRHVHMTLKSVLFCIFTIDNNPHLQMFKLKIIIMGSREMLFTPQPSGLEGYCCHGPGRRVGRRVVGWAGRPLPNLRNPYLCNRLMEFLHSKFCEIV